MYTETKPCAQKQRILRRCRYLRLIFRVRLDSQRWIWV